MRLATGITAAILALVTCGGALAGTNPLISLALDMQLSSKTRGCATMAGSYTSCSVINQSVSPGSGAASLDVIPVVYNFSGLTGVEFGLDWGTTSVMYSPVWTKCADLEGTRLGTADLSTSLVWTSCLHSPSGLSSGRPVGWLRFSTTGAPGTVVYDVSDGGMIASVDCSFSQDFVCTVHHGFVNGAEVWGVPPCVGFSPTEPATWSGVKQLYR